MKEIKVTLYIAFCEGSGLKYFGKTTRFHTETELQNNYHGSGTEWLKHIAEYGEPNMTIFWTGPKKDVESIALKFSKDNNIALSSDWLNQKSENGLDGGSDKDSIKKSNRSISMKLNMTEMVVCKNKLNNHTVHCKKEEFENDDNLIGVRSGMSHNFSEEECKKISDKLSGVPKSEEHKKQLSISKKAYYANGGIHHMIGNGHLVSGEKNGMYNKNHTEDTPKKMKMMASRKKVCPHCGICSTISNMTKYHFDKCKYKDDSFWEEW